MPKLSPSQLHLSRDNTRFHIATTGISIFEHHDQTPNKDERLALRACPLPAQIRAVLQDRHHRVGAEFPIICHRDQSSHHGLAYPSVSVTTTPLHGLTLAAQVRLITDDLIGVASRISETGATCPQAVAMGERLNTGMLTGEPVIHETPATHEEILATTMMSDRCDLLAMREVLYHPPITRGILGI